MQGLFYFIFGYILFTFQDEALLSTMLRYAAKFNVDYGQLQFSFDGDNIEPSDTPEELDLEDGFCIDVRL